MLSYNYLPKLIKYIKYWYANFSSIYSKFTIYYFSCTQAHAELYYTYYYIYYTFKTNIMLLKIKILI